MRTLEQTTFDSLVERYRESMTRAAYHLCGDREAAYDIVQDTLVDAYKGLHQLREQDRVGSWLYAILRRKAAAFRKARRPETELVEETAGADCDDAGSAVRAIVIEQMSKLADEDRDILAGKYLLGLSYKELADSLGIKEGAVRVRCLRAKERLRNILSGVGLPVPRKRKGDENGV